MPTSDTETQGIGHSIVRLASVDSTNAEARRMAASGAAHGAVILAGAQDAGRGRLGRSWSSPAGLNIYMSIILRPSGTPALSRTPGLIPLAAGLAAVNAIRGAVCPEASLKWPNDIMAKGGKLGGILLEARSKAGAMDHAVLGIGINVNSRPEDFPDELRSVATSLLMETGRRTDMEALIRDLIKWLSATLGPLSTDEGSRAMLMQYRAACSTLGQRVRAETPAAAGPAGGGPLEGMAANIDDEGRLVIETPAGLTAISAADIIHLRPGP